MEPSLTWNFQFKLLTKTVELKDIYSIDGYLNNTLNICFDHLQNTPEINRVYSLSIFLLHYFINKLQHFRTNFQYFTNHFLRLQYQPQPLTFDITKCICIFCKFPNLSTEKLETTLEEYFHQLKKRPRHVQLFMLTLLEKSFELQCLHTLILKQQYPHLDNETISNFVINVFNPK
jgi:hypothetical protein